MAKFQPQIAQAPVDEPQPAPAKSIELSLSERPAEPAGDSQKIAPSRKIVSDVDRLAPRFSGQRPDDFALIVGIEGYQGLPPATYGEKDAATVRKYIQGLGVPEENIIFLSGSKATRTGLTKYIEEWLPRNATEQSRVYFYYSGHGAPDPKGSAYLIPWDGDPSYLQSTAYPITRLYAKLQALKAKEVIAMLDSCFSGAGGRSVIARGTRPLVNVVAASPPPGAKLSVLTAAAPEEIAGSIDDQQHGMFTYYLLKGLGGAAVADGRITIGSLYSYVQKNVERAARRQNREQSPQLYSNAKGLALY